MTDWTIETARDAYNNIATAYTGTIPLRVSVG